MSKNTNELKTRALGRFGLEVSTLGWRMEAEILGHENADPAFDMVEVVVIAGWAQRDRQNCRYRHLLEKNRVLNSSASWEEALQQALADPG